jgi:hypothetical protein
VTAPDTIEVGQDFQVGVGTADIRRVTLVKTGSVTHSVNMDQRFVELPFTSAAGTLFVQMTDNVTDVPPGYYMLFAIDQRGVPSRAKMVRVNIAANPVVRTDFTPIIGGTGGTPFTLSCNSDETLVGLYGYSAGTYVNRVGARCVRSTRPAAGSAIRSTAARRATRPGPRSRRPARATPRSAGSAVARRSTWTSSISPAAP